MANQLAEVLNLIRNLVVPGILSPNGRPSSLELWLTSIEEGQENTAYFYQWWDEMPDWYIDVSFRFEAWLLSNMFRCGHPFIKKIEKGGKAILDALDVERLQILLDQLETLAKLQPITLSHIPWIKKVLHKSKSIKTTPSQKIPQSYLVLNQFLGKSNWKSLWKVVANDIFYNGAGALRDHSSFYWKSSLIPFEDFNSQYSLNDIIGYDYEKNLFLNNLEAFTKGLPANNVAIYGARGTGKSTLVRAGFDIYRNQGLKIVEVSRGFTDQMREVIDCLRVSKGRFLVFLDDLHFEHSQKYHEIKAVLDGGLLGQPENIVVVATSNIKDLVRFEEKDSERIDAHQIVDDKRAVDDRFGLKLFFNVPSQKICHEMLRHHARRMKLRIKEDVLLREFLIWFKEHNHDQPNGRTARDFINYKVSQGSR